MVTNKKEPRLKNAAQQAEFDCQATEEVGGSHYEARGGLYAARGDGDDEDPEHEAGIRASLEHSAFERDRIYYPESHFEYGGGSGSIGTSSVGSTSTVISMNRSGSIPFGPQIGRSSSMRVPQSKGGICGFFTNLGASGRKTNVDVSDLDPRAFPPPSIKQPHIDDAWGKMKKWDLGRAISKWFHFSRISANAANNPYYRTMVSTIQKLDRANSNEHHQLRHLLQHEGCLYKSVNSFDEIHDAYYISKLMTEVIEEIGPQNVVQVITDNGANFKRAEPLYKRNWSTFALIHTKPRNRLSYARLKKLVYVHYNMRLRLRAMQNEDKDIPYVDPFDVEFVQGNADPIFDWWSAMETDPPLLDEPGKPPRPSPIISDAVEFESQPEDTDNQALERDMTLAPLDSQRVRQTRKRTKKMSPRFIAVAAQKTEEMMMIMELAEKTQSCHHHRHLAICE
ncbi:hypothetical protein Cni_G02408 [Canna indica]|uniref:DUF659 domain-containing protein n=1 Tax=Canna indica TaxID=4628 RepID=A0AAQ3JPE0_9LILI|nr:hypothetical protein Cni_G02408 [Canna indica]